jgi:hypothetical protein
VMIANCSLLGSGLPEPKLTISFLSLKHYPIR